LLKAHKRGIEGLLLIPSDGGCFEVSRDGQLAFSKLASGRFPEDGEIRRILSGKQAPVI
jgi:selT/selW/selH-like putative selenoprotein